MKKKIIFSIALMFFAAVTFAQNFDSYRFYVKGMLEQRSGKLKDARKDYEKGINASSGAFTIYKDLMDLYLQLGDKEEALQTAEKLNEFDGQNPKTTAFLGNFYMLANSTENAKKYWDKTLEMDPNNETALYSLAIQYSSNNDFVQSEKYLKRFLDQETESILGYLQLGYVQEKQNENEAALKTYDDLIKLKPEAGDAYVAKARIYENTGKFDLAAQEYEKVLKLFPHNAYVLIYMGRCYYLLGNFEKARETLLEAKEVSPEDLNVAYWLGAVYERLGRIDDAINEFEFITKKEENLIVMARLGYFYGLKKDLKKAEKYFVKALSQDPNNPELLFFLGLNYMDDKKYDKAISCFTKLVEVRPDFADGYFFLGNAYDKKGDFSNTEKYLLKAIEVNPEHLRAMNYLGYLYADKNINVAAAKTMLETIVSKEPQNGFFIDSLGWLYYRQAQYVPIEQRTIMLEQAQRILLAGVNLSRDPLGYEHLGDAYAALNNNADAWVVYGLAYEITGDSKIAKKMEAVQKKLTDKELFSKMLFRSESQYLKLFSLRAGYKVKVTAGVFNIFSKKDYVSLNYIKDEGILIEFPANIMLMDTKIYIKDDKVIFVPKALRNEIYPQIEELINLAAQIFDKNFYRTFDNSKITNEVIYKISGLTLGLSLKDLLMIKRISSENTIEILKNAKFLASQMSFLDIAFDNVKTIKDGNEVIYETSDLTLVLSLKDSLIKRISNADIAIEILKNTKFLTSQIPSKIKITSKKLKFTVLLEADKFNLPYEHIVLPKD